MTHTHAVVLSLFFPSLEGEEDMRIVLDGAVLFFSLSFSREKDDDDDDDDHHY